MLNKHVKRCLTALAIQVNTNLNHFNNFGNIHTEKYATNHKNATLCISQTRELQQKSRNRTLLTPENSPSCPSVIAPKIFLKLSSITINQRCLLLTIAKREIYSMSSFYVFFLVLYCISKNHSCYRITSIVVHSHFCEVLYFLNIPLLETLGLLLSWDYYDQCYQEHFCVCLLVYIIHIKYM